VLRLPLALGGALALALAFATTAYGQTTELLPGVTYEDDVQLTPHGPVAIRVIRGPRPTGLFRLEPALSNETVIGRETLTSIEHRLGNDGTAVGINGDYFSFRDGHPSGILMRNGALVSPPNGGRSSLGIGLDGTLDVERERLSGSWQGLGQRRALTGLNAPPAANGASLFTSDWGGSTPSLPGALALVLSPFPTAAPNTDLVAPVSDTSAGAPVPVEPGTAVLVARGAAARILATEAPLGSNVTIRLALVPSWAGIADAIGGGPILVRNGRPVFSAGEGFTTSQLAPRAPRSAVGQLPDGRILLVAVDGRQAGYSVGLTNFELAQTMMRLGAVRAMALDTGGSTTLAFDGTLLNRPSDGRERPISTALLLTYSGVYAPPPKVGVVSPNGDGVDDRQQLSFKVVRPSTSTVTLREPDGTTVFQQSGLRQPGSYRVAFPPPSLAVTSRRNGAAPGSPPDGRWTFTVAATDDEGAASSATRRFWVNSTLGYLRLAPRTLALRARGGKVRIGWTLTRTARVTVRVETASGTLLRTVARGTYRPGRASAVWNGMRKDGRPAFGGTYQVVVSAENAVGSISLTQELRIRRL
jgi:Phosphodiester glycosidase/FlgD Ig-like domain